MTPNARRYLFDVPGTYRIRIQGRLETQGDGGFACMMDCASWVRTGRVRTSRVQVKPSTITTLTGTILDQASLISVLTQLYDLGYPLLDVRRLPDKADTEAVSPQPFAT